MLKTQMMKLDKTNLKILSAQTSPDQFEGMAEVEPAEGASGKKKSQTELPSKWFCVCCQLHTAVLGIVFWQGAGIG